MDELRKVMSLFFILCDLLRVCTVRHHACVCMYLYTCFSKMCAYIDSWLCCCCCMLALSTSNAWDQVCKRISAAVAACCLVYTALHPWPSTLCDPAYGLICLHHRTGEVTTHQSAVRFRRISTRDIWGVEGHSQVLCHVVGFWLTGHVVPRQALLCIDLGLAHVIVSPGRRVMLHGMWHAGAHRLQSEQYRPNHRWSRSVWFPWNFLFLSFIAATASQKGQYLWECSNLTAALSGATALLGTVASCRYFCVEQL